MMKLNYKFVITALFLLCALLIAGCSSNDAPQESVPPEATPAPFADSDVTAGIQSGTAIDALLGVWNLDKTESTAADAEEAAPVETEATRTYEFKDDGTGSVTSADATVTFDYAMQGNMLTFVTEAGAVEMYQTSFNEDGALLLTRINNDGTAQEIVEYFVHPDAE